MNLTSSFLRSQEVKDRKMVEALLEIDLFLERVIKIEHPLEKEERTSESRVTSKPMKLNCSKRTLAQLDFLLN